MDFSRVFFWTLLLTSKQTFAAGGGHHADVGIPWDVLQAQTFNFVLFLVVLIFLVRKPAAEYFTKFRQQFLDESGKAQKVVAEADKHKKEIEDRLKKLETTYSSKMEVAKQEAKALKEKMIFDAQEHSERMIFDANENASLMFKNAERAIQKEALEKAVETAKQDLGKKVDDKDIQRLHDEFIEEIRVNNL